MTKIQITMSEEGAAELYYLISKISEAIYVVSKKENILSLLDFPLFKIVSTPDKKQMTAAHIKIERIEE